MLGRLQLVEENVHQRYNLKVQCVGFRSIYMYPKVFHIAISLKLSWFYLTKPQCQVNQRETDVSPPKVGSSRHLWHISAERST